MTLAILVIVAILVFGGGTSLVLLVNAVASFAQHDDRFRSWVRLNVALVALMFTILAVNAILTIERLIK